MRRTAHDLVVSYGSLRLTLGAVPAYAGREPPPNLPSGALTVLCARCELEAPAGSRTADGQPACANHAEVYTLPMAQQDSPSASAGMVGGNVRGVDREGKRPSGAAGWEYRPPHAQPSSHADLAIELNGKLQFQQRPPVHVPGSAPGSPRDVRRQVRAMSEARAERIALDEAARAVPRGNLPELLGVTRPRLSRLKVGRLGYGRRGGGAR